MKVLSVTVKDEDISESSFESVNGRQARLDIFTDNSYDNDPEPVLSGNITETGTAGQIKFCMRFI